MILDFSQGIITYPRSGAVQEFLVYDQDNVTLDTSNGRVEYTIAFGSQNYLFTESQSVYHAWQHIDPTRRVWLYWDIDTRTAVRTFGSTYVEPKVSLNAPVGVEDLHWFDLNNRQMKVYKQGNWQPVIRVFAATVLASVFSSVASEQTSLYDGTQVGLVGNISAGRVIVDENGIPIRTSTGMFFTTENEFFVNGSPVNTIRIESNVLQATARENIGPYQIVKYTNFGEVGLALYNDTQASLIAIATEGILTGSTGTLVAQGVITNTAWNWPEVGVPLWIHDTIPGLLVDKDPYTTSSVFLFGKPPVARVLSPTQIFFDQGMGGKGEKGAPGSVFASPATTSDLGLVTLSHPSSTPLTPVAVETHDPRMSDARPPLPHTHDATSIQIAPHGSLIGPTVDDDISYIATHMLDKQGDVMTGALVLSTATPSQDLEAAPKKYVDSRKLTDIGGVLIQNPVTGQVLTFDGTNWVPANLPPPPVVVRRLAELTDVTLTTPVNMQVLSFNGTQWINKTLPTFPTALNQLSDVGVDTPISGQQLIYNGTKWVNTTLAPPVGKLNDLSDVLINNPLTNQLLTFNGTKWVNSPQTRLPYALADLTDVTAVAPLPGQVLTFDGSKWVSITPTAASTALSSLTDVRITSPILGQALLFDGVKWNNGTIPAGVTQLSLLTDVSITSPLNQQFLRFNGTKWVNSTFTIPPIPANLSDLGDVSVTSPSNQQFLRFNGTKWINSTVTIPPAVTHLSDLSDVAVTSPQNQQMLMYNGVQWVNAPTPSGALSGLTDVAITAPVLDQVLRFNGTKWINNTLTFPTYPKNLYEQQDVSITAPVASQVLTYNGAKWVNSTPNNALGGLVDVVVASPTTSQVLTYNGVKWTNQAIPDPNIKTINGQSMTGPGNINVYGNGRETLFADRTYYVSKTGNDTNDGLSPSTSFLTIQKAINAAASLDNMTYAITVSVGDGTYAEAVALKPPLGSGALSLIGNISNPSNVTISPTNGDCITASAKQWRLAGVRLIAPNGNGIVANPGTFIVFDSLVFGACNLRHIMSYGGSISTNGTTSYTITGNAISHHASQGPGANINITNTTITLTGTPAFRTSFAYSTSVASIIYFNNTFVGSATGLRYNASMNAIINTMVGSGANYLPGNAAGTTTTGGQYA